MIKNKAIMECVFENRVSHWHIDADCPLNVAREMLSNFGKYLDYVEEEGKKIEQERLKQESNAKVSVDEAPKE